MTFTSIPPIFWFYKTLSVEMIDNNNITGEKFSFFNTRKKKRTFNSKGAFRFLLWGGD